MNDVEKVRARLDQLRGLKDGWLDGAGLAITEQACTNCDSTIDDNEHHWYKRGQEDLRAHQDPGE